MPSLCGKSVGVARRELLAADPDLTIAIDGSDEAIVHTQIPPPDEPLCERRQVRLSQAEPRDVEIPNLQGLSVAHAYMVSGERRLDLLIADDDVSVAPRRPTARDARRIVVRHVGVTPPDRKLVVGGALLVKAGAAPKVAKGCIDQFDKNAPELPDFAVVPAVDDDASEPDPPPEYARVEVAMSWCSDHGRQLQLFEEHDDPWANGKPAGPADKDKKVVRHHDCTPVGSQIKGGGIVGLVVRMPPTDDKLKPFLAGLALGLVAGVLIGLAL